MSGTPNGKCLVCGHPLVDAIEAEVRAGTPHAAIGRSFGIPRYSVGRHTRLHLREAAVVEVEDEATRRLGNLEHRLALIEGSLTATLDAVLKSGKTSGVSSLARELRLLTMDVAKLRGVLDERRGASVDVLALPSFREVAAELLSALRPYPEARLAVANVLSREVEE